MLLPPFQGHNGLHRRALNLTNHGPQEWRLLDTGPRNAAENMALDEAILQARAQGLAPNTIRFLEFDPAAVLVGFHQSVEQEVRAEFCLDNGIDINRRITGGGSIYFGSRTLGWEIIASKSDLATKIPSFAGQGTFENLCRGVVKALSSLGVEAVYRPKNDIEVGGRKISGTGGTEREGAFLFQGTLLVDFDVDTMLRVLRIPVMKLKDKEIDSVKERVTCLRWELGYAPSAEEIKAALIRGFEETFNLILIPGLLTGAESRLLAQNLTFYGSTDWIHSQRRPLKGVAEVKSVAKTPGGLIRVSLSLDRPAGLIKTSLITGDFFVFPSRAVMDLEARLKNTLSREEDIREVVHGFFDETGSKILGVSPGDLVALIMEALEKTRYESLGISLPEANHLNMVNGLGPLPFLEGCDTVLLPYCAKLPSCEYRFSDGCTDCGLCSYGEAHRLVEEAGMKPVTILNFEHLMETLQGLRERGTKSYLGCCCEGFYWKHQDDFKAASIQGVLIDIDDHTCYDLGKEQEALAGSFESQTDLKTELLAKLLMNAAGRRGGHA
ncbi:lipoate--protein ligase [Candidatus Bathyarchaeota archaeon]|nr:lipoate--protein ligase [Candidatus Bathyarchaeota archaeon]